MDTRLRASDSHPIHFDRAAYNRTTGQVEPFPGGYYDQCRYCGKYFNTFGWAIKHVIHKHWDHYYASEKMQQVAS